MGAQGHENDIGHLIKIISDRFRSNGDALLKEYGLTIVQMHTMWFIHSKGGSASQRQLEAFLEVTHPTVVGIVNRMEKNGFLTSGTDPKDRRNKILYTTEKADEIRDAIGHMKTVGEELMRQGLSAEEATELVRLLKIVNRNLEHGNEYLESKDITLLKTERSTSC